MILRSLLIASTILAAAPALAQSTAMTTSTQTDPYLWLEDKDGAKPLAWVEAENARTLPRLQNDPRYGTFYAEALAIASAKDRIPMPSQLFGRIYNFWRDADHPQGIWRWTSEADYARPQPKWTTVLDLDALSKAEGKKWVWKGATCLQPEERLCLVALSEGGEDAISYREFDLASGQFVAGGFALPKSKQGASWLDKDTLLVSRDWGEGTMTASSYPFVVKTVKRGQPLAGAQEIFRGQPTDQLGTYAACNHRRPGQPTGDDRAAGDLLRRRNPRLDAGGNEEARHSGADQPGRHGRRPGAVPDQRSVGRDHRRLGRLGAARRGAGECDPPDRGVRAQPASVGRRGGDDQGPCRPDLQRQCSRACGCLYAGAGGWTARPIALPDNVSLGVASADDKSDHGYLTVTGFLTPTTLLPIDAASGRVAAPVKTLPAKFDASNLVVEQHEATSTDGTKVPYFIVHKKGIALDGSTPTIMTAYGGFELPMLPGYSAITGKLWLERGGSYVLANIRGGGEFGPKWHDAGRKTKRQVIYDDFASVAKDLFTRKLTSPAKLGIYGGSNGGLLMGVEFNQHPDLWKAVTIQVPLLDMLRYEQIAAGASWVDEYGSVSVPEERAFLATISPYQNIKRGVAYPEPYIWTTTKDDRVGPQHARKFAARLKEYGCRTSSTRTPPAAIPATPISNRARACRRCR